MRTLLGSVKHARGCLNCRSMAFCVIGFAWKGFEKILCEAVSGFRAFREPGLRCDLVIDHLQRTEFLGLEGPLQGMTIHSCTLSAWGGSALPLAWMAPLSIAIRITRIRPYRQESTPPNMALAEARPARAAIAKEYYPYIIYDSLRRCFLDISYRERICLLLRWPSGKPP